MRTLFPYTTLFRSNHRLDFTVMGQAVNLASRIESLCGGLGLPVLFSDEFASRLPDDSRFVDEVMLKGQETPTKVFSLTDEAA